MLDEEWKRIIVATPVARTMKQPVRKLKDKKRKVSTDCECRCERCTAWTERQAKAAAALGIKPRAHRHNPPRCKNGPDGDPKFAVKAFEYRKVKA